MDIIELCELACGRNRAQEYLLDLCLGGGPGRCPRCGEEKPYQMADGRLRCRRCAYTFHGFSRRFLSACAFTPVQWLWFLKLFELGTKPRDVAAQMRLSLPTVHKANDVVRRAVVARSLDAAVIYAAGIRPGPGRSAADRPPPDSPVFGVIEIGGQIRCDCLPEITPETLIHFKQRFRLATRSQGGIVYTAPYRRYLTLAACGPSFWPAPLIRHDDPPVAADSNPFWSFAKDRLLALRGVAPGHFPLHIKEIELRYNHRDAGLFKELAEAVCALVPDD